MILTIMPERERVVPENLLPIIVSNKFMQNRVRIRCVINGRCSSCTNSFLAILDSENLC